MIKIIILSFVLAVVFVKAAPSATFGEESGGFVWHNGDKCKGPDHNHACDNTCFHLLGGYDSWMVRIPKGRVIYVDFYADLDCDQPSLVSSKEVEGHQCYDKVDAISKGARSIVCVLKNDTVTQGNTEDPAQQATTQNPGPQAITEDPAQQKTTQKPGPPQATTEDPAQQTTTKQ